MSSSSTHPTVWGEGFLRAPGKTTHEILNGVAPHPSLSPSRHGERGQKRRENTLEKCLTALPSGLYKSVGEASHTRLGSQDDHS